MLDSPPSARRGDPSPSRIPPINKHLYLALSHEPENLVRRFITSFVVPSWKEARFIGALDGWVVILIDRKHLFLLNKGFNSIIPLPPLPDSDSMDYGRESMDYYFFKNPESCKAALSSPPSSSSGECTVVLSHSVGGVFYCRLGSDKSFTNLSHFMDYIDYIEDILFYKGRLYVLCSHCTHTIIIFDHLLNMVSSDLETETIIHPMPTRLLISGNDALCGVNGEPHEYSVFTLELEGNEPRMVGVNNIGEDDNFQILLSNQYCSLSLTTEEHKEFRRDYPKDRHGSISTFVIDTSKDPNKANADDPWPLFFVMFSSKGIKNEASPIVMGSHKAFVDEKRTKTQVLHSTS